MKFNEIPDAFGTKLRLHIIASLLHVEHDFKSLKEITGATDGNLSAQLTKLVEAEYITMEKKFVDKKPQTTYYITKKAAADYKDFITLLVEQIVKPK